MLAIAFSVVCVFKSSEAVAIISETSAEWSDKKTVLYSMCDGLEFFMRSKN